MVVSGGASQASNAYPLSRVADAVVGYDRLVAGSADARVIVKAANASESMVTATPLRQRRIIHTNLGPAPYRILRNWPIDVQLV
jgi:hypothetical protein